MKAKGIREKILLLKLVLETFLHISFPLLKIPYVLDKVINLGSQFIFYTSIYWVAFCLPGIVLGSWIQWYRKWTKFYVPIELLKRRDKQ